MPNSQTNTLDGAAAALPRVSKITLVEMIEKTLVFGFFVYFAANIWSHIGSDRLANLLLLMSEGLTAALVIFHRPTEKVSTDPGHWLLAISVSFLPAAITPAASGALVPAPISDAVMMFGFLLSLVSKLCLARSFGIVPANRGVRRAGPYAILRHPIYAGYLGFLAAAPCFWNLMVSGLIAALLVRRIMAEEAILSRDGEYRAYAAQVRYRLLPGVL